jgi:hypothetical protein
MPLLIPVLLLVVIFTSLISLILPILAIIQISQSPNEPAMYPFIQRLIR